MLSNIDATVYCDDVNNILRNILRKGYSSQQLPFDSIDGKPLARFPEKGDVDIVSLTPPCTGFSGLNR